MLRVFSTRASSATTSSTICLYPFPATISLLILLAIFLLASPAIGSQAGAAGDFGPRHELGDGRHAKVLTGEAVAPGAAKPDTIYLLGSGGPYDFYYGDFQDAVGAPSWDRWYGVDYTQKTEAIWHIDTYNAATTPCLDDTLVLNHSWWCGERRHEACTPTDPAGGYGNNYDEYLDWWGEVAAPFDPEQDLAVTVAARLSYDNEPGYDYLYLQYEDGLGGMMDFATPGVYNGKQVCIDLNEVQTAVTAITRPGHAGKWVHLRWRATSDGAWSDEDCNWPTEGAAQLDNIAVFFTQGASGPLRIGAVETCEDQDGDGQFADDAQWGVEFPVGVGDYARIWPLLQNIDPCCINPSPQAAFFAHPATGLPAFSCTTWCYGPGGYIVHPEGGQAGPDFHIQNEVLSPVMCWPGGAYDGGLFAFTVWRHEPLVYPGSSGMFYQWHVRSTVQDTGHWPCPEGHPIADPPYDVNDPAQDPFYPPLDDAGWSGWQDRNFVYYGGPDCHRSLNVVSDLLEPGRKYVQVALGVYELGWIWGFVGTDGTPAPYYDDVRFCAYAFPGPAISTREIDIAQDNFPAIGTIDTENPCQNSIRFDMARTIALPSDNPCNLPGDSIVFDIVAVRTGTSLVFPPRMFYKLDPNPVFNACRTSGLPNDGSVPGRYTYHNVGSLFPDRYNFDLPDSGFFFPGDVIHWYLQAEDDLGGISRLPGDTTGFSLFPGDIGYVMMRYPSSYIVRGLPSLRTLTPGDQPALIWWNDFADRGLENEWYHALWSMGYSEGFDFDTYYTNGPSSGVGNGLGGRATATQLAGYDMILYSSGDLGIYTLSNGDCENDPGPDVSVLENWLLQGGKCLLLSGNDLIGDLNASGAANLAFENTWIQVAYVGDDVRSLIPDAAAVAASPAPNQNPIFYDAAQWVVYSSCNPIMRRPDAIQAEGNAQRIAEWLDPSCSQGGSPLAAAVLTQHANGVNVITLPYDLGWVIEDAQCGGYLLQPPSAYHVRMLIINDVAHSCGFGTSPIAVPVAPRAPEFSVAVHPSPFNPKTRIAYVLPAAGRLAVKIYDLRGRLVKTLLDGEVAQSGSAIWWGEDDHGATVASGVYVVVASCGSEVRRVKVAHIK
jgi:hypothetical protein